MRPGFQARTHLAWSHQALRQNLQSYEKELIEAAFAESKTEKVAGPNGAAAKVGIPRSTLDSKIKTAQHKEIHVPVSPVVQLPEFWQFPRFCHSHFYFEPCFQ